MVPASWSKATVITRSFSHNTEMSCQLDGLPVDHYKNGLNRKHFRSMAGDKVRQEFSSLRERTLCFNG